MAGYRHVAQQRDLRRRRRVWQRFHARRQLCEYQLCAYDFRAIPERKPGRRNQFASNPTLVAVNPAWYNTAQSFDFQLQAGSPAMGAGLASDAPATDIMGKPRGSTPDVGAYQSSGNGATRASFDCRHR